MLVVVAEVVSSTSVSYSGTSNLHNSVHTSTVSLPHASKPWLASNVPHLKITITLKKPHEHLQPPQTGSGTSVLAGSVEQQCTAMTASSPGLNPRKT